MTKKCALLLTVFSFAVFLSGCVREPYEIYTNYQKGECSVTAKNFVLREGLVPSPAEEQMQFTPPAGFTQRTEDFYAMNATATLVVSADFSDADTIERYNSLSKNISEILCELDESLSATAESSSVAAFNDAVAGETVEIDYCAYELLTIAKDVFEKTEGYYNPAVYHSVKAFGFLGGEVPESPSDLPAESLTDKFSELSGKFGDVRLYNENGVYYVVKPDFTVTENGADYSLSIDLGGIGKGYAVDSVNALINEYGFSYGYFDFAGSSIAVKKSVVAGNYTIGFRNPRGNGYYVKVNLADTVISTSGDYFLYHTVSGKRYCSVINPHTGRPVETGVVTVTVIDGSAAENDAYTTAVMAMGKEKAVEFVNTVLTDRKVIFVCGNGG